MTYYITINPQKKPISIKIWAASDYAAWNLLPKYIGQPLDINKRMLKYANV